MTLILFAQLIISGLCVGSVYGLIAIGYNLIFSTKKVLNFAQGDFVMLGAMVGYSCFVLVGLPIIVASLAAAVVTMMAMLVFERVAIRPFRDPHRTVGWVITSIGAGIILQNSAQQIWGSQAVPFPPFIGVDPIRVLGIVIMPSELCALITAVALTLGIEMLYSRTIIGKAVKATALDIEAASLMGIKSTQMVALSFAASGIIAAIAGILISPITYAGVNMGVMLGIKGFAAAALGGLGLLRGALIGGLLLGLAEVLTSGLIWSGFQNIIAFTILIVVLIFRPSGIMGKHITEKV